MAEVGSKYVTIMPSFKGMRNELDSQIERDMRGRGDRAGKMFGGAMLGGALASTVKLGAVGAGVAAGLAGSSGFKYGLEIASQNEQAMISFETMLGSAEKAKGFLGDLQNFAAKTPFEFPGLQKSASQLLAAGFNAQDVIPIMTTLGDVTSGMGTGAEGVDRATIALQQMSAAGKISGEDLNQLRDAGIPVYDLLASATGKSKEEVVKLAQAGKLGKKELEAMLDALKSGKGLERFSGLMDKQSQSLSGLVSTAKDTLGQGLGQAIAPLIPALKVGLGAAISFAATALGGFGDAMGWLVDTAPIVTAFFSDMIRGSSEAGETFAALSDWVAAGSELIKAVFNALVGTIQFVWARWGDDIIGTAKTVLGTVASNITNALNFMSAIFSLFKHLLTGDWGALWGDMKKILSLGLKFIGGIITGFFKLIGAVFSLGLKFIGGLWSLAWADMKHAAGAVTGAVVAYVKSLPGKVGRAAAGLGSALYGAGRNMVLGFINGIKSMASRIIGAIRSAITDKIPSFVKDALGIHSPSRVFMQLGQYTAAGMAAGILSGAGAVQAAADSALVPSIKTSSLTTTVRGTAVSDQRVSLMSEADIDAIADAVREGARAGSESGLTTGAKAIRRTDRQGG